MSQDERRTPRPLVEAAGRYSVPRAATPVDLHLDANEGAAPPSAVWQGAFSDAEAIRRYPSKSALEAELADYLGAAPEQVLVTAGGDEAIDRLCRAFLDASTNLVVPTPSFVMIANSARLAGAQVREVEWDEPKFPLATMLEAADAATGLVAVVSPNNPNGYVATEQDVRELSAALPGAIILLDLAYVEFAEHDLSGLALELPNVVAVRTFSKARGMAGLRVGYAFGDARWIGALRAAGGPYPVSAASLALASASLEHGEESMLSSVDAVRTHREEIREALTSLGVDATRSEGNFVLADVGGGAAFRDAMAGMGIAVRAWPGDVRLDARSRITIPASPTDTARLKHALGTVRRPEALIFDVDGVLCDVRGSYRAAIIGTCAHFGVEVDHDDIVAMKAAGDANNDWIVSRRLLGEAGVEVGLESVTEVFERLYQGTEDVPGLWREERTMVERAWFEGLAERGFELALVTGRPRRDARRFVEEAGFEGLFGALVCMEDAPRKPDPAPVRLAMETIGATTAWFLGDTVDDVRAGRAAAVLPIGIAAPGEPRELVEETLIRAGAAVVWDDATDIERWLS